jgi:hypothetical protein
MTDKLICKHAFSDLWLNSSRDNEDCCNPGYDPTSGEEKWPCILEITQEDIYHRLENHVVQGPKLEAELKQVQADHIEYKKMLGDLQAEFSLQLFPDFIIRPITGKWS